MRGMFKSKTGRSIGIASIAAPLIGYVVNDLQKPDSMIRALVERSVRRLLPSYAQKREIIDISDKVEIIEDSSQRKEI